MLRILILLLLPQIALANVWQDLWFNKNQQGSQLLKQNKNDEAAQTFTDKNWKGIAYYRDGKYQEAYDEFKQDNSAQGLYNQGNALAHMQKYQEAIDVLTKALSLVQSDELYYNRSLAYIGINNKDAAIADLRQALAINPNNQSAQIKLSEL